MSIDTTLFRAIHGLAHHSAVLDAVGATYALWLGPVLLALLLVESWWRLARRATRPAAAVATTILAGVAAVVALLVNQRLLSPSIARPRPCRVLTDVHPLLTCSADYSMPSDHAVIGAALAAGVLMLSAMTRRWGRGIVAVVLVLLLAVARVFAGVHYPSDVVVGLLYGAAVTVVLVLALRRPTANLLCLLARTPLRALVTAGPQPLPIGADGGRNPA